MIELNADQADKQVGTCSQCYLPTQRDSLFEDFLCQECRGNLRNVTTTDIHDLTTYTDDAHNSLTSRTFSNQVSSLYSNQFPINRTDSLGLGNLLGRTYSQQTPFFLNWASNEYQQPSRSTSLIPDTDLTDYATSSLNNSLDPFVESTFVWNCQSQSEQLPLLSSQYPLEEIAVDVSQPVTLPLPNHSVEVIESSDTDTDGAALPTPVVADCVDEWNVGSLLIDELCNRLNVLRSNIRDSTHALYDLISRDKEACFEHFKDLWTGSSPRLVHEIKAESVHEAKAARDAAIAFEQQPQRYAHAECVAACCFYHAFNEDANANHSLPSKPRKQTRVTASARGLLTIAILCGMMPTNPNNGTTMHTVSRLESYHLFTQRIAALKVEPIVPLIDKVLETRPLLVEACKPSFLEYTEQFAFNAVTLDLAIAILNRAVQLGISVRRNHNSLSAAAIFIAAALEAVTLTQYEFCRKVNLTEVTLRKVIREFAVEWNKLLPTSYTPKAVPQFLAKHKPAES